MQRHRDLLIALALAAAVIALFARTTRFDFVRYDDDAYVIDNPRVQAGLSADNVRWAFTPGHGDTSRRFT